MLAYETSGKGIPLVLLHAYPLSGVMWDAEREHFASRMHVIVPDLPGFGRSPRQATPSIPDMAVDVARVLDTLAVREPIVLCGLSMGGYVALEFARQFPDRVRALGLFSARSSADTPEYRRARLQAAHKIRKIGLTGLPKTVLPKLLGTTARSSASGIQENITRFILQNEPEGVADALHAMADRRDSTGFLPSLRVPVLVVAGDEDAFIPLDEARSMHENFHDARLEIIRKAGHLVNLEQPVHFQACVQRFFEEKVFAASSGGAD